ncbi:MAG TPA: hypothetical protein VMU30_06730 [Bacteroidota bacterium]|nr:hypothetical protein [Bacteroidota bacterium]
MKKKQMVLAVLMIGAVSTFSSAQTFYPADQKYSSTEKERVDKNYANLLESRYNGIVESALAVVTMVKLDLPADEFSRIKNEIDRLALDGATPVIRYKAYLAEAVFTNPAMFKEEAGSQYRDEDAFFSALAQRMTKSLLSSR